MKKQFLTPTEVAEMLQLKKNTVYDMIKRGDLKASKMGKQFRIRLTDVYEYMGENRASEGENNIIICGQDALLDILCAYFNRGKIKNVKAFRSPLGSYNGLYEMYQNEGYIATAHLWDGETDTYNIPYVTKMLPGEQIAVYHLVNRLQGMYVRKGNPKQIVSVDDLLREDVVMVNREKGSGIRVYLDEMLKLKGILPKQIKGYQNKNMATSHLQAAAMIARGNGDVSFGNERVGKQVEDIEFIPLKKESYDMILRCEDLKKPAYAMLVDIIQSEEFQEEVQALHGYDVTGMGERIF